MKVWEKAWAHHGRPMKQTLMKQKRRTMLLLSPPRGLKLWVLEAQEMMTWTRAHLSHPWLFHQFREISRFAPEKWASLTGCACTLHLDFPTLKLLCCLAGTFRRLGLGLSFWSLLFSRSPSRAPLYRWADDVDKHSSQEPKWGSSALVCACRRKADP